MRVAALYDIHGNLPALEAVLADVEEAGVDAILVGSDGNTITRLTPDERLRTLLERVEQRLVVCGHTHMQFDRRLGDVRVVNAGSVGLPYEAEPGAYWLLAGPEVSFRRTHYDVEAAAARIRASGYPNAEHFARELLSCEPSRPGRMAALIERGPA